MNSLKAQSDCSQTSWSHSSNRGGNKKQPHALHGRSFHQRRKKVPLSSELSCIKSGNSNTLSSSYQWQVQTAGPKQMSLCNPLQSLGWGRQNHTLFTGHSVPTALFCRTVNLNSRTAAQQVRKLEHAQTKKRQKPKHAKLRQQKETHMYSILLTSRKEG